MTEGLDWIVSTARQQDPSLDHDVAVTLATQALPIAKDLEVLDPPDIARRLLGGEASYDVSHVNAVAVATVDYLQQAEL